ncbi:hypothetical protein [Thauera humireducens]|uniref:hypothetical protein n=1 Tax=Thauera humireducens TaxID=1134435 RepID=UPI00311F71DF
MSGSVVRNSVLFSNVLVRSYCDISDAVVLPDVQINRHCWLERGRHRPPQAARGGWSSARIRNSTPGVSTAPKTAWSW